MSPTEIGTKGQEWTGYRPQQGANDPNGDQGKGQERSGYRPPQVTNGGVTTGAPGNPTTEIAGGGGERTDGVGLAGIVAEWEGAGVKSW